MESKEAIDLKFSHYLPAVKRHWLPAVSIFASTFALSILAASLLKPSYQAEGRLLFKNSNFKVVGSNLIPSNSEGESGDLKPLVATQNPITTQMEVIASTPLLQKTAELLNRQDPQAKRLDASDIQAGLTSRIVGGSDILQINYKGRNARIAANIVNTLMGVYLENDILTTRSEAESARQFMEKSLPKMQAAVTESEVALRKFKQKNNVVDLAEESRSAVTIIGNLDTSISAAQAQLAEVTAQTQELQNKVDLSSQEAMAVSTISQSPAIQGILTQLQDVDRQLASESSRFSDNNPIIVSLKEKQAQLKTLLARQIGGTMGTQSQVPQGLLKVGELKQNLIAELLKSEVQLTGLTKKLASLQNSRSAYEKRVNVMPQLVQTQRQLERQLEVSQSTYQNLLKKVQELQLAKTKNTANARIVAGAIVPQKSDNNPKILVGGLGLLVGAFLGASSIAYLESRDRSFKTVKEIEKIFGYTLLGVIPANNKKRTRKRVGDRRPELTTLEVAVRDTPQSLTSEMSRVIQSNLRFLGDNRSLKTIAITSAVANEGKSKVAANLAAAIAGLGQRVLLIDADLRVPTQHRFWKLPLKKGLSELLAKKSKFQQISWTVMENLDILTAGARPPNPLGCLESSQMATLLHEVSWLYDFVIIDTPPLLVASDAITIGQMTDGIILVSRPGVIDASSALAAKAKINISHVEVLGSIVNGAIAGNETEDYFADARDYFSDEPEAEIPWTDYMTQLGETIADRSRQDTKFTDTNGTTTMLNGSKNFRN
jgi:capsular exopolysaccharide synthesis family protein